MERKSYTTAEKARIVARGEARLGVQHFFDVTKTVPVVKSLETLDQQIEKAEDKFHDMYTQAFAKAIANLRSSQDLRRT
jgi:glutathionylspermidine synthase